MAGTGRNPEVTQAEHPSDPPVGAGRQLDGTQQRIRQLHDDLRRSQGEARELRATVQRIERENSRRADLLIEADALLTAMEAGLHALLRSISLQLGYVITRSVRSVTGMLALPYRVAKLVLEARRSGRSMPGEARQLVTIPLPHDWFAPALRQQLARFHAEYAPDTGDERKGEGNPAATMAPRVSGLPANPADLRVAAIMDEFTFNAYRDCCDVKAVTPEGWRGELELHKSHLLFIESAWDGKDSLWQRKISNASAELHQLVAHCRRIGVPVIFWSKEDPVHFKTFLDTARLADFVFTTDIDCIKHYKLALGHERVYLLPFATQPRAHDPIERYNRKHAFCFAGSYYVRYPTRQKDFANLIAAVSTLAPVDIYDRNHGKTHPNYIFPEQYRPHILGSLPFEQIDMAYKGYQFGININTVKHSQSMFARRVFDLLASNTVTVSNYSRGMRLAFGDLVIASDDSEQLIRQLKPLVEDPVRMSKFRLAGLRKVMREHTYQHRLGYVVEKVFGHATQAQGAKVVVLANVVDDASLDAAIANYRRQQWVHKRLLLSLATGFLPASPLVADDVEVILADQHCHRKLSDLLPGDHYFALFAPGDYYGPNYLVDLALATGYSPVDAVGKHAYYRLTPNGVQLENAGGQYQMSEEVALHRALVLPSALGDNVTLEWVQAPRIVPIETLTLDEFNYCAVATAQPGDITSAVVDDLDGLDEGLPVDELLKIAEDIRGGTLTLDASGQHGIEEIGSKRLHDLFGTLANKYLSMEHDGNELIVNSTVPPGKHAYCYLTQALSKTSLNLTDVARMQLVCEPGKGLELVLVFQDEADNKLGHSIVKAATNITASVPAGTIQALIGLRLTSAGRFAIKRLALDHVPLQVDTIIGRSRTLLLAKNYPSYRDRYKHAFVHRRATEYDRCGASVDVFRIGSAQLCFSEHEGVDITEGQFEHLRAALASGQYRNILAHVLTEQAWEVLQKYVGHTRIYVWAHGSEVQPWTRRSFEYSTDAERDRATVLSERRMRFWKSLLKVPHPNLVMVFVSHHLAETMFEDLGFRLPDSQYRVIHNFVDDQLFAYRKKSAEQRTRIISIRPYAGRVYANDLTVQAIVELSRREFFDELQFHLIGDGVLFDDTVEPVRAFPNVRIERRFLSQREIADLHADYGVFLCPTRMDSQGVSRDEAMASGLVPITNPVAAVPEFVDENCGLLVEPENAIALADAIERLYREPELFMRLSRAAAARVREQSAFETTIAREIELFDGQARRAGA
ncbi:glycosyltransferase family protein [Novilysobacter erysipheiresistens]|uniref:Glycosyltransferase n=1 Tax=Novilysobacter erysipheiresistens TaxID=1749332 RepID=A0ABU7YYW4_9GAMM